MAFNINVFNSCKFLAIRATQYDPASTSADIVISNVDPTTPGSYTAAMTYDLTGKGRINVPTENLNAKNGVFKVCVVENGVEQACKPGTKSIFTTCKRPVCSRNSINRCKQHWVLQRYII